MKPTAAGARLFAVPFVCAIAFALASSIAQADNQVTVRGQYFREPSTRVVQPVVEIAKDLPAGIDVRAHYLLDAITSASAASGPTGDNIFTEYRSETGLGAGVAWSRWQFRLGYKYSAESDYWSHALFASAAMRTWGDSGTFALSLGGGLDQIGRRIQGNAPTPAAGATCVPGGKTTCPLKTLFGGIGYSQVLSPTVLVQVGYEFAFQEGYLSSPYRMEMLPDKRWRNALLARGAKYFPGSGTGIQIHYRYYWDIYPGDHPNWDGDPWGIRSHTVEGRMFQMLGPDLELRLTGRYYSQGAANIWCDVVDRPGCQSPILLTNQPQLASINTAFLEAKLYWAARRLRGVPFVGWFSEGTFELSYGRFLQSTSFANAHVLQTGYSLPF